MTDAATAAQAAYDAAAHEYDHLVREAPRAALHDVYRRVIVAGAQVIDAGCGTGIDTAFLSGLGARVVGVDISERMLEVARGRPLPPGCSARFIQGDLTNLRATGDGPVDVIVSAFAAVNTGTDLAAFSRSARSMLRSGGTLVLHVLTPGGIFDRLGHLSRGRLRAALGARRERMQTLRIAGIAVPHLLVRPDVLYGRFFSSDFVLEQVVQTGAFTPDDGPSRVPAAVVSRLARLDRESARWPWIRHHGRFGLLVLRAR